MLDAHAHAQRAQPDARRGSLEDVKAVLDDFVPPSYPTEIELQNLVAVLECTSRKLLPEKYRGADRVELIRRVNELESLVREGG